MRLILILSSLLLCSTFLKTKGQERDKNRLKPFSILLVNPDTVTLSDSLMVWADSIEQKHKAVYYASLRSMELLSDGGDSELIRDMEQRLQAAKEREEEVINFKYYQMLTNLTFFELRKLFQAMNDGEYIFEGFIPSEAVTNLKKAAKFYKVDYIAAFRDVRNGNKDGVGTLSYRVTLFSRARGRVILEKEIEGNARLDNYKLLNHIYSHRQGSNYYHESGVDCDNYLECMFQSAVRFSTEEIFKGILKDREK